MAVVVHEPSIFDRVAKPGHSPIQFRSLLLHCLFADTAFAVLRLPLEAFELRPMHWRPALHVHQTSVKTPPKSEEEFWILTRQLGESVDRYGLQRVQAYDLRRSQSSVRHVRSRLAPSEFAEPVFCGK